MRRLVLKVWMMKVKGMMMNIKKKTWDLLIETFGLDVCFVPKLNCMQCDSSVIVGYENLSSISCVLLVCGQSVDYVYSFSK